MCQCLRVGEVVDGDEIKIAVGERSAENVAAYAAKAVDAYFDCHIASSRTELNTMIRSYGEQVSWWNQKIVAPEAQVRKGRTSQFPIGWGRRRANCSELGKRVTSATCADGCATAVSGANSQWKSQDRRTLLLYRRSFPSPRPTKPRIGSPISRRGLKNPKCNRNRTNLRSGPRPVVAARRLRSSSSGEIVRAVVGVVVAVAVAVAVRRHRPRCRQCPGQEVPPAKLPRLRKRARPLKPRNQQERPEPVRSNRPESRKGPWYCPLGCPARAKAPGSSATTFCRCPATWSGSCCSTT